MAGAGISTDSGIPDFRGPQGLWTKNPAAERAAHIDVYVSDPEVRKQAWRSRLEMLGVQRRPNPGHMALVHLERRGKLQLLVTQNVDGLHHAAGNDPDLVVEVHGNVREAVCLSCGRRKLMLEVLERVKAGEEDPRCPECGGILKSATVSFGQPLDPDHLRRAHEAARTCDLMMAVGTSLTVFPICEIVPLAAAHGAAVVIVNGEPTPYDDIADVVVRGSLSETLPVIVGSARL